MGRRDYDDGPRDRLATWGDGAFTAAVFIKYADIVIVVLVIAYVVLRIVGASLFWLTSLDLFTTRFRFVGGLQVLSPPRLA